MVFHLVPASRGMQLLDPHARAAFIWDDILRRLDLAPTGKIFEIVPEPGETLRNLSLSFRAHLRRRRRNLEVHYLPQHNLIMVWKERAAA